MKRRKAREIALKVLFQVDVARADPDEAMSFLVLEEKAPGSALSFARELVAGTLEHQEEIDKRLSSISREWTLERMANIDRNVLRMGCYELMYRRETPPSVSISEAIELAKAYGDADSGKFVNGLLGRIAEDLDGASGPGGGSLHVQDTGEASVDPGHQEVRGGGADDREEGGAGPVRDRQAR